MSLQDFDNDFKPTTPVICAHFFRYLLLIVCAISLGITAYHSGLKVFVIYFTLWTALVQTVSVYLTIVVTSMPDSRQKPGLLATHHIFYTASIAMNFITVTVYWSILHEGCLVKFSGNRMD